LWLCVYYYLPAKVAELADALDLGSSGATRGGSSPPFRISHLQPHHAKVVTVGECLRWESTV
jgi:hypothetical protein